MELQLGLSLPTAVTAAPFDLNGGAELQQKHYYDNNNNANKRGFDMAFPCTTTTKAESYDVDDASDIRSSPETITLPLFVWSADGGREENNLSPHGDRFLRIRSDVNYDYRNEEKEDDDDELQIVGWPPIRSWGRNKFDEGNRNIYENTIGCGLEEANNNYDDYDGRDNNNNITRSIMSMNGSRSSRFVKVKMEGVGIIRKIDLSIYHSYPALIRSLLILFSKHCQNSSSDDDEDSGKKYTLMYQNKAGDWITAGDVPWQKFIRSVQRIEILMR
ncbi:unnamed protein product [Linum trigynum]|uniref:Auxin-responsive protein n=1 Tax=Linum trigynum TaxID=586398 RepID=A0AAV2DMA7_9ROSI